MKKHNWKSLFFSLDHAPVPLLCARLAMERDGAKASDAKGHAVLPENIEWDDYDEYLITATAGAFRNVYVD